jgi:hypothetical protein
MFALGSVLFQLLSKFPVKRLQQYVLRSGFYEREEEIERERDLQ